ncbi:MAG: hypothetical protein Kow0040_26590 [Thermogutta sp.]
MQVDETDGITWLSDTPETLKVCGLVVRSGRLVDDWKSFSSKTDAPVPRMRSCTSAKALL